MSSLIKILPDTVINKIAAGEVVERPASVVKELVENSLDAGASEIVIEIEQAGRRLIRITDNGCGMAPEDARIAFERHATSKITSDADLEAIRTMGFRGEALSSIASVSRVRMVTARRSSPAGTQVEIEGGSVRAVSETAAPPGTCLEIADLFYNTPARLKFLKSPATEFTHILTAATRQAVAHPAVRFRLSHNNKTILDLPVSQSLRERLFQLYGNEIAENTIEFSCRREPVILTGLLGRAGYSRSDKTYQDFYVNRRAVRNVSLTHALYAAYGDLLMRDRHPAAFLFLDIDPAMVDVNVHPAKTEVRFRNQSQIHDFVRDAVREALRDDGIGTGQESPAERVREAVEDYVQKAEFGIRKAEFRGDRPRFSSASAGEMNTNQSASIPTGQSVNSELRAPHSEFLVPLAQVHDSFILAQSQQGLVIIDQHAAHERVLFEKLQSQFDLGSIPVQNLLIPAQVELGPAQSSLLVEHLQDLAKTGFGVEDFGNGTFVIKYVPSLLVGADYRQLLLDILDELNLHGTSGTLAGHRDGLLSVMACHPAIKLNRRLEQREMEQLLSDLSACRMPHTCPHGRPTMLSYSIDQLKKMFKRT